MVRTVKSTFLSPVNSPSSKAHIDSISPTANSNPTQKRPNCHEVTEQTATSPEEKTPFWDAKRIEKQRGQEGGASQH
ncbi:hypothetical protein OIU74_030129 [Salix koriyanagi]|uniref:Uncharacterized protein n=1 Tax=Salix koriyanagi TaxID=2511006 RepID=A0A9Q0ZV88_9ROSI|nr:hypothetical protein OIU74_030129 [Salix koriyanagi]